MYKDEEKEFDIRVVEKHIQGGTITRVQLTTYLKKLPDVSSNIDDGYHFDFLPSHAKKRAGSRSPDPNEGTATQEQKDEG